MNELIWIPGYRIVRTLGRGGMATVYLAIQECLEREVALKVMAPILNLDASFTLRFIREARIVAQMTHSSIIQVHDVGEYEKNHYLSMEYLPGIDLKQRILQGQYGVQLAVQICTALASALDVAHRKGFVHRDIKPENVLFREDGTPVLTDFGIARAIDAGGSMTRVGMLVGTPSYMSPEQVQGLELDGRSDLYSLGILFYEMLTGAVPFRADSLIRAVMQQVNEPLPRLPAGYEKYQSFVDRLTAKDRNARFSTGTEVLAALQALGQPHEPEGATQIRALTVEEKRLLDKTVAARQLRSDSVHSFDPRRGFTTGITYGGEINRLSQSISVPVNFTYSGFPALLTVNPSPATRTSEAISPAAVEAAASFNVPLAKLEQAAPAAKGYAPWMAALLGAAAASVLIGLGLLLYRSILSDTDTARVAAQPLIAPATSAATTEVSEAAASSASSPAVEQQPPLPNESVATADIGNLAVPQTSPEDLEPTPAPTPDPAIARRAARRAEQALAAERERAEEEARAAAEVERQARVQAFLARAEDNLRAGRLVGASEETALGKYRQVLALSPTHLAAVAGINRVAHLLIDQAEAALNSRDFDKAQWAIREAESIEPANQRLVRVKDEIALVQSLNTPVIQTSSPSDIANQRKAEAWITKANGYLQGKQSFADIRRVTRLYDDAARIAPTAPGLAELKGRISSAYVSVARARLDDDEVTEVVQIINYAREKNWLSEELLQMEASLQASVRLQ